MILLAVAFGLSIIVEVAEVDTSRQPPPELAYPAKLVLRAAASFIAASGFAISFNSPARTALAVGCLALVANELRLVLTDTGLMIAPAAFLGALSIGMLAVLPGAALQVVAVWQRPWHRRHLCRVGFGSGRCKVLARLLQSCHHLVTFRPNMKRQTLPDKWPNKWRRPSQHHPRCCRA